MIYTSLDSVRSGLDGYTRNVLMVCMLAQVFSLLACKRGPCDPAAALKTPALYLQHVGDEDKPIKPIVLVLGTERPTISEFQCATPTPLISAERNMYALTNEEFLNAVKIIDQFKDAKPPADGGEYRYVLVRGPGTLQMGRLDRDQSKLLFAALQTYFKERKPEVYTVLSEANRMF